MAQDGFVDWLRDTFSADPGGFDDLFTNDQKVAITLPVQQTQQLLPDTAVLIQQMETSLTQDDIPELADIMAIQDCDAAAQHSPSSSKAASAKAGSQRPKNTKRYKSLAQKEAHKRYRERKRASITAMEATVQEMLQQLRELEVENEQLKSRCRVLETSVNCSTQIHEIMQLLEGMNGMSLNPDGSSSPASGSSGPHAFGMQSRDRRSSTTASDTSGGDTWSSGSGFACPQQQQQHQAIPVLQQQQQVPLQQQQQQQQPQQDPWQRMAQTRVITTGAVNNPAAAAAGNGTMAEVLQLNRFTRTWSGHSTSVSQQQRLAPLMGNNGSNGRSTSGYAPAIAVAAAPAGPAPADYNSSSNSLQAIFAEVAQQQSAATAASRSGDVGGSPYCSSGGSSNPLAGAVTSEEQGLGMYKEFLRQASQLMLQTDSGGIGAESARTTLEDLTRVTMSRFQPFLVAKGQGLVYSWITRNLETGQHQEPPEELWPKVLEQMHLSPQQQRDALACYRMFSICLSKLVDKRVELSAQYKAIQQHSEQCELIAQQPQQGKLEAAADYRKSKLTSASMEVLQSLAKNLAAYQSLDGVFAHSVTSLLTGVQMATACVHSYPFLPQWHTMMRYLQWQEEASQQAAQQQQQAGPGHAPRRSNRGGRAAHQVATSALKA